MIKRLRILVFDYWHYLLFGIFALVVILGVIYFNQQQYEQREKRLNRVSIDKVTIRGEHEPAAPPDGLVNDMLLPPMDVYLPLPDDWPIRENWGDPVWVRERRIPDMVLQVAPPRMGPDVTP